jgi:hypothetical protein
MSTFDEAAKTISDLLEQLKIRKCSFYLHDYGGPVGFRIRLSSSRMPTSTRKALAQSGRASRGIGPIQKRILKCSMPLYR